MPCAILELCQLCWARGQPGAGRGEEPAQLVAFPAGSRRALLPGGHMPWSSPDTGRDVCPREDARNGLVG